MSFTRLSAALILIAPAAFAQQQAQPVEESAAKPALGETRTEEPAPGFEQAEDEGLTVLGVPLGRNLIFRGKRSHAELRSSRAFSGAGHFGRRNYDPFDN